MLQLIMAMVLPGVQTTQQTPSIAEIEKAAIDARLRIRTIYVRFRFESAEFPTRPNYDQTGVRTVWLDGKKIRGEIVYEKGPDPGHRFVSCLNCEREGYGVDWANKPGFVASFHPIGTSGRPDFSDAIDPRILGYYPLISSGLRPSICRIDGVVGSNDRDVPKVASEKLADTQCRVLRWTKKEGQIVTVWIAPAKGNNVVRMNVEAPGSSIVQVESDLEQDRKSGLWFPREVRFEARDKTGMLKEREVVTVEEVRINEPIAPSTFALAGLNITEGTYVQTPNPKDSGYLRNGKIDPTEQTTHFEDTTPVAPTPLTPQGKRVNYWLVAACLLFVIAAAALVVFRRKQTSSS